jgi:hypothetical protein
VAEAAYQKVGAGQSGQDDSQGERGDYVSQLTTEVDGQICSSPRWEGNEIKYVE